MIKIFRHLKEIIFIRICHKQAVQVLKPCRLGIKNSKDTSMGSDSSQLTILLIALTLCISPSRLQASTTAIGRQTLKTSRMINSKKSKTSMSNPEISSCSKDILVLYRTMTLKLGRDNIWGARPVLGQLSLNSPLIHLRNCIGEIQSEENLSQDSID